MISSITKRSLCSNASPMISWRLKILLVRPVVLDSPTLFTYWVVKEIGRNRSYLSKSFLTHLPKFVKNRRILFWTRPNGNFKQMRLCSISMRLSPSYCLTPSYNNNYWYQTYHVIPQTANHTAEINMHPSLRCHLIIGMSWLAGQDRNVYT